MSRRLAGLMVVLVAIVGVAATQAPARLLDGRAGAILFPGPPAVGDCLIDPLDEGSRVPAEMTRQVPQFGSCAGRHTIGEVVSVRSPAPAGLTAGLDDSTGCRTQALIRAGLVWHDGSFGIAGTVSGHGAAPGDPVSWQYSIAATTAWIGQIPWSPAASAWAACIVRPIGPSRDAASIAGSFAGGVLPSEYGTCWASTKVDAAMRMVNCALPHAAELIALGSVDGAPGEPWDDVVSSCVDQAGRAMRRDDPTVGGLLDVDLAPDRPYPTARARDVTCYVAAAGHRRLVGSVVGLGAAHLRFAE